MRCKKDCARGSAAPLANGLSTVYGWHDGDRSHRSASSGERSAAVSVVISVYSVSGQPYPGVSSFDRVGTDLVDDARAMVCSVHLARGLVPVVSGYYSFWNTAATECEMETS